MTENKINNEAVKNYFTKLQTDIINAVEIVDGKNFLVDSWQRSEVVVVQHVFWKMEIFLKGLVSGFQML